MYKSNMAKELSLLVVGKSGAGKSEFVNSFAENNKLLDASGKGQTTRTSVIYHFYNKLIKPSMEVELLNEEEFVENRMEQIGEIIIETGKYRTTVKDQILDIEGFFNINEFSFIDIDIPKKVDQLWNECFPLDEKQEYTSEECNLFKEKIKDKSLELFDIDFEKETNQKFKVKDRHHIRELAELMLQLIYKICIKKTQIYYSNFIESDKVDKIKFDLTNISEFDKKLITYSLKVDNGFSITGLISKVIINDQIASFYLPILEKLKIQTLTFVDTYGLDHEKIISHEGLKHRYSKLFSNFPEISTVLFIRALGDDSPADLNAAIPQIYSSKPSVVPYIVFTRIDENQSIEDLSDKTNIDLTKVIDLKAVKSITEPKAAKRIKKILEDEGIPDVLIESRYKVLNDNLISYCSIQVKEYLDNNHKQIEKLFKSIANKEHLGEAMVNITHLLSLKNKIILNTLLKKMFKEASIDWEGRPSRTIGANRQRFESGILGYDGTYLDSWNLVFNLSYNQIFSKMTSEEFQSFFEVDAGTNEHTTLQEILNGFSSNFLNSKQNRWSNTFNNSIKSILVDKSQSFEAIVLKGNPEYKKNNGFSHFSPINKWLSNIYNFENYFNDIQDDLINFFYKKFSEDFIKECREHNARILASDISLDDVNETLLNNYYENYDNNCSIAQKSDFENSLRLYIS